MSARTPEECDRLFGERINRGDLDGVVALYEANATFVPQSAPAVTGTAIRKALAGLVATKASLKMNVTTVIRGGDDVAVLYNGLGDGGHGSGRPAVRSNRESARDRSSPAGRILALHHRRSVRAWLSAHCWASWEFPCFLAMAI